MDRLDNLLHYGTEEEIIAFLLERPDLGYQFMPGGQPPLILAASMGLTSVVDHLLRTGQYVDQRDSRGQTALHTLCEIPYRAPSRGDWLARALDSMKLLRDHRCTPNLRNLKGQNAISYAAVWLNSFPNEDSAQLLQAYVEAGECIHAGDRDGNAALHWLCIEQVLRPKAYSKLVELGADLQSKNSLGQTPLVLFDLGIERMAHLDFSPDLYEEITSILKGETISACESEDANAKSSIGPSSRQIPLTQQPEL